MNVQGEGYFPEVSNGNGRFLIILLGVLLAPPLIGGFGAAIATKKILLLTNVKNKTVLILAPILMSLPGAFVGIVVANQILFPGTPVITLPRSSGK